MEQNTMTSAMQEMLARMAALQAELDALKQRAATLPTSVNLDMPAVSTTRRSALRKLAGGLIAGLAVGGVAALIPQPAEAKFVGASNAGAIIIPPGATATGTMGANRIYGVVATSDASTDLSSGFYFADGDRIGVYGLATNAVNDPPGAIGGIGVYGIGTQGIFGYSPAGTGVNAFGVTGLGGSGGTIGVLGIGGKFGGTMQTDNANTFSNIPSNTGIALVANAGFDLNVTSTDASRGLPLPANQNIGLYVTAGTKPGDPNNPGTTARTAKAAIFGGAVDVKGNLAITGSISKGSGTFKIDHPLDPTNKFLSHSFVESPDMKNVYDGVVTLNNQGEAFVELPSYFEALNTDFRYQLTPLGQPAPNLYVAEKLSNLKFKIAGGAPGQEISWQLTGIRQDFYAKAHPINVEEDKTGEEKGTYLHPELFGQAQPEKQTVHSGPVVGADLLELIKRKNLHLKP